MAVQKVVKETELASLAKRLRILAKKNRAQAARDMKVAQTSIFHAEESPRLSYVKLRIRMIEAYSSFGVVGPVFILRRKRGERLSDSRS